MERDFGKYLWKGGVVKIAMRIWKGSKEVDGLGLTDISAKENSLKMDSISYKDSEMAGIAYSVLSSQLDENIWRCNIDKADL